MKVLNAAGAHISTSLLDRLFSDWRYTSGGRTEILISTVRFRSHSLQTEIFAATGFKLPESAAKRVAPNGVAWALDDSLPLDVILLESVANEKVLGRLENLYPICPTCLEYRLEKALRAEGLLKVRAPRTLIQVKGKSVSETLIEDRE